MRTRVYVMQIAARTIVQSRPPLGLPTTEVWADWDLASHEVIDGIDEATKIQIAGSTQSWYHDPFLQERLIWKRLLSGASWFTVQRDEQGELTDESLENDVLRLEPRVSRALVHPLNQDLFISPQEAQELYRQGAALFSPHSSGVAFPNKWIKRYCDLALFWDKFGVQAYQSMSQIPHAEYLRLKRIIMIENERREIERNNEKFKANRPKQ